MNLEIWREYDVLEEFYPLTKIELFNLYSKNDLEFLKACKVFEKKFYEEAYALFQELHSKEANNLDYLFALSACSFYTNTLQKTIDYLTKCVFIVNSYHCYFHYFGFEICMKLFKETGEQKFFERAKFLYPEGLKKEENVTQDFLPAFKNLCIFENSVARKIPLKEAFEKSEKEHYEYHLAGAKVYFLRGLCFKMQGKSEIAKVDFERALNMEIKNPFNENIKKHCKII